MIQLERLRCSLTPPVTSDPKPMRSSLVSLALLLPAFQAHASCHPDGWSQEAKHIASRFGQAEAVFIGQVVESSPHPSAPSDEILEKVTFEVVEHFKGSHVAGTRITVVQTVDPSRQPPRGRSVVNNPVWMERWDHSGQTTPEQLPTAWLVYANGPSATWLGGCTGSNPLLPHMTREIQFLRSMAKQPTPRTSDAGPAPSDEPMR